MNSICDNTGAERKVEYKSKSTNQVDVMLYNNTVDYSSKLRPVTPMLDITVNKADRTVRVKGFGRFKLAPNAYTQNYINPEIASRVYVEVFTHKKLEWLHSNTYGWYRKNVVVRPQQSKKVLNKMTELNLGTEYTMITPENSKLIQFNSPKAYVIVATKLTKELYNRCLQLLKYGISPWLYIEDTEIFGVQLKSPGNTKSMLDQSFNCESDPSSEGALLLKELRAHHEAAIWDRVIMAANWLWTDLQNLNAERFYEDNFVDTQVTDSESAILSKYARAYGFEVRNDSESTMDRFADPRDMFSNKPMAYGETSLTLWDYEGRVEKATIKARQKSKVNQLGTSAATKREIIAATQWLEAQDENLYLDQEYWSECECGTPVNANTLYCEHCNHINENYEMYEEEILIPCMRDFVKELTEKI
jgi:uncharacterized protein YacL (UPF0231 family)